MLIRADDLKLWLATQQGTEGRIPAERITEAKWNFTVAVALTYSRDFGDCPLTLGEVASRMFQGPITSADSVYLFKQSSPHRTGLSKCALRNWMRRCRLNRPHFEAGRSQRGH